MRRWRQNSLHEDYPPLLHEGRSSSSGFSRVIWGRQPLIMSDMCSFLHICFMSWNMEFLYMFQEQGSTPLLPSHYHNSHLVEATSQTYRMLYCTLWSTWSLLELEFIGISEIMFDRFFSFWHFNCVLFCVKRRDPLIMPDRFSPQHVFPALSQPTQLLSNIQCLTIHFHQLTFYGSVQKSVTACFVWVKKTNKITWNLKTLEIRIDLINKKVGKFTKKSSFVD